MPALHWIEAAGDACPTGGLAMPNYRRVLIPGITYFFTVVTYKRQGIPTHPKSRLMLREVVCEVRRQYPFKVYGWVLLPNHTHCIWVLPENDNNYSKRWGLIKARFSKKAKDLFHHEEWMTDSKRKYREATIWQRRFWEHTIRNERDLQTHLDYLHYNPVKHGLVKNVRDWPYSTFHSFVKNGFYPADWCANDTDDVRASDFGE